MNLHSVLTELKNADGELIDRLEHVLRRGLFSSL